MSNNNNCSLCQTKTSFERHNESEPPEGEICGVCGKWVCPNCVDWKSCQTEPLNEDIICVECIKQRRKG